MNGKKAAVFILLGQSNAVGHGIPMREEEAVRTPLKNVFGLHREENQSLHNTALHWRGYTSAGMNLAEQQDDTWSVATKFQLQIQMSDDGLPSIGFLKDMRRGYVVESSSDLVNWSQVEYMETTGDSEVAVPLKWQAPASGQFFRVRATDPKSE